MKLEKFFNSSFFQDSQEEPTSARQAKSHIKKINEKRGLDGGKTNVNAIDLAEALKTSVLKNHSPILEPYSANSCLAFLAICTASRHIFS
jgi:hypothetical protein